MLLFKKKTVTVIRIIEKRRRRRRSKARHLQKSCKDLSDCIYNRLVARIAAFRLTNFAVMRCVV
jgi:hypothetical protein